MTQMETVYIDGERWRVYPNEFPPRTLLLMLPGVLGSLIGLLISFNKIYLILITRQFKNDESMNDFSLSGIFENGTL